MFAGTKPKLYKAEFGCYLADFYLKCLGNLIARR